MLFLNRGCYRFIQLVEEWTKDNHEIHLIFYEDIVDDPIKEARKMIQFLNIVNLNEITLEQRIACQEKKIRQIYSNGFTKEKISKAILLIMKQGLWLTRLLIKQMQFWNKVGFKVCLWISISIFRFYIC